MSIISTVKSLLTSKAPAAQLAEIREKLAAATAEVQRLDHEIARRAMPIMMGDAEAMQAAAECERQKQAVEAEIRTLRNAEADRAAAVAAEAEATRRAAAAALPREIAEQRETLLALDDDIMAHAEQLAAKIKQRVALGSDLAAKVGSETLRRADIVTPHRIRTALANLFRIDPGAPNTTANNLLHLKSDATGPRAWMTLREFDHEYLDDEAPFYLSEAGAEAAKERLAARGVPAIVQQIGAAWTVTQQDHLFTSRAEAETAVAMATRAGRKLAVLAHGPGFLVRPERFADSAIVAPNAGA